MTMRKTREVGMKYPTENSKSKKRYAIYICDSCKNEYEMQVQDAKRCGDDCNSCSKTTHGMTGTENYSRWTAMKTRCRNKNTEAYVNYGGRGIYICDDFLNHFEIYSNYIDNLPNAHKSGYTVDRIDNNSGYEYGNLMWSSRSEQGLNRRTKKTLGVRKSGDKYRYTRTLNGKYLSFGTYSTEEEAIRIGTMKYNKYKQANTADKDIIDVEAEDSGKH